MPEPESSAMKVFVSYSHSDEVFAGLLAAKLRDVGFAVWIAAQELRGGDRLSSIATHLPRCDAFVVLLSRAALASAWVSKEINMAVTLQIDGHLERIVPCLLEDGLPIPLLLADCVAVRLSRSAFDLAVQEVTSALLGESRSLNAAQRFRQYYRSLILIDEDFWTSLDQLIDSIRVSRISLAHYVRETNKRLGWTVTHQDVFLRSIDMNRAALLKLNETSTVGDLMLFRTYLKRLQRGDRTPFCGAISRVVSEQDWDLLNRLKQADLIPFGNEGAFTHLERALRARASVQLLSGMLPGESAKRIREAVDRSSVLEAVYPKQREALERFSAYSDETLLEITYEIWKQKPHVVHFDWVESLLKERNGSPGELGGVVHTAIEAARSCGILEDTERRGEYFWAEMLCWVGPVVQAFFVVEGRP